MRILVLWSRISGYKAACWRSLADQPGVQVRVIAWDVNLKRDNTNFDRNETTRGLDVALLNETQRKDAGYVSKQIEDFAPDAILVVGWFSSAYRNAIEQLRGRSIRVVMGMDTPWRHRWKQRVTRFRYGAFLRCVDHVLVAGERSWQYARQLGFSETRITRGLYAWDDQLSRSLPATNAGFGWLFVGRYAPEKGIDTLLEAYRLYRSRVENPWSLTCCGAGELDGLLENQEGVVDRGFTSPADLPGVFAGSKAFVFPSTYEPWGVALAEAMGCGLPAISTHAVGAAIDLIRDPWNGRLVASGSVACLTEAMIDLHNRSDELAKMKTRARIAAEPFGARYWGKRVRSILSRRDS